MINTISSLQYYINIESVKISALSSGQIYKYEYLTGKEILQSDQSRIIEQAKLTYSPLGKALEKQLKTIENQGIKPVEVLKALKPGEYWELKTIEGLLPRKIRNNEIKNELDETKKWEEKLKLKDLIYKKNKY